MVQFKILVQNASGDCNADFLPKKAEPSIVSESRLLILSYTLMFSGALLFGSTALFWIWILPVFLGQPFLRLFLLAEHGLCPTVAKHLATHGKITQVKVTLQGDYKGGWTILTAEKPTINVIVFMFSNMGINSRGLGAVSINIQGYFITQLKKATLQVFETLPFCNAV